MRKLQIGSLEEILKYLISRAMLAMLDQDFGEHISSVAPEGMTHLVNQSLPTKGKDDKSLRSVLWNSFRAGAQLREVSTVGHRVDRDVAASVSICLDQFF
eukprot:4023662-Pyramimonas_sp.AAC.2